MKAQTFAITALAIALAGFVTTASAANRYVRAGAAGNGSGSDWNNAYTSLPSTLVRGDTYFIADGTYGSYTFRTPASGTTFINIKKATVTDHGTDTGWSSAYGDGEAVMGKWVFDSCGYVEINGYTPHMANNYGIRVDCTWHEYAVNYNGRSPQTKFYYIEFDGPAGAGDTDYGPAPWSYGFRVLPWNGSSYDDTSGMVISHCAMHGFATFIQDNGGNANITVEYTDFYDNRSVGEDHGNIYWVGSSGGTFRYNKIHNYNVEGVLMGLNNSNWKIYGNVFYDGVNVARGVELYGGRSHTGTKIYNNTFVNIPLAAVRVESSASCSGVEIRNNLLLSASISMENGGAGVTSSGNISASTADFVGYAAKNFRLARATTAGMSLVSPYHQDPDGRTRGQDGSWDIGAFEFGPGGSGGSSTNPAISVSTGSLDFGVQSVGAATNLSFTLRNAGGGILSGVASVPSPFSIVSGASYNLGSNQSQTVTVRYQPTAAGNHNQNVAFSSGGASVTVNGSAYVVLPGLTFNAGSGVIGAPFVNSGGIISQATETGVSDGGRAVYAFTITNAGNYTVQAVVEAPDDAGNSLFINIDAEPTDPQMIWHIPTATGFQTQTASWQGNGAYNAPQFSPKVFSLGAGTHQLIIRGREANVRLQSVSIVNQSSTSTPPTPAGNFRFVSSQ